MPSTPARGRRPDEPGAVTGSVSGSVTGAVTGASSGIGAAFARALSARGHPLLLIARDRAALEAVAAGLPGPAEVLVGDLGDAADLAAVERRIRERGVLLLVNCAATGTYGPILPGDASDGGLADVAAVNVVAPVRLVRAALPAMVAACAGGVVTVSSPAGALPAPRLATYAASKAFADSFDGSLRAELAELGVLRRPGDVSGVTVTTVWPGWTRTAFHDRLGQDVTAVDPREWTTPEAVAEQALDALDRGRVGVRVPRPTSGQRAVAVVHRARSTARESLPGGVRVAVRAVRSRLRSTRT